MTHFILMLTQHDETVKNAFELYDELRETGVHYVGFKDVGLPIDQLTALNAKMQADGRETMLEVISLSEEDERRSAEAALEIGVDYLVGGTRPEMLLSIAKGNALKLFPYVGRVVGHPAVLEGAIEDIVIEAKNTEATGVHGINLLSYRYVGDPIAVTKAVVSAIHVPLICAGSVRSVEQIHALRDAGAWAFTIGGAVIERAIVPSGTLTEQIDAVLDAAA
jgi:NAD(P)H-dependent flavin oxidoreductase YrpB (nitropropane dioxygenase family)